MQKTSPISLVLWLVVASSIAQPIDTLKKIDELFAGWNNSTPGGAVMVARGQQIIYDKAFGLADLEHNVPNVPSTIFEAGSVSKQFTAMSVLLLAREGKLSLDDDVRKYLPELPTYSNVVRIKHLLNHTSGLKDWGSVAAISGWPRTTKMYTQDLALQILCRQPTLNFKPGAEYSYSNSNYTALVFIVERVSGKSLGDFTSEKLFKPVGMTNTKWRSNFREVVPGRSIAYQRIRGAYDQSMPFEHTYGHAGLLTTTADLTMWNRLLETHTVGGDEVYRWRVDPGKLNNGAEVGYGAGLSIGKFNEVAVISHSGATAGYRAWLAYYPSKKISVAILSNDGNFNAPSAGNGIAELYLGKSTARKKVERKEIVLTPVEATKWAGIYRSIRGFDTFSFEVAGNEIKSNGKVLKSHHRDSLYLDELTWTLISPKKILLRNPYDTTTYVRVSPPDLSDKSMQAYLGTYYSVEAETTFKIELKGDNLVIVRKPFRDLELDARFKDAFVIDGYDLVEFNRNKKGTITGFELSTSRAQRIKFVKNPK